MYSQEKYLNWNFYYNMKLNSKPTDTLKDNFKSKDIIYVAEVHHLIIILIILRRIWLLATQLLSAQAQFTVHYWIKILSLTS